MINFNIPPFLGNETEYIKRAVMENLQRSVIHGLNKIREHIKRY